MRIDAIPEIHELLRTKSKKANHRRQRNAVVVTRFCEFTRMTDGKPVPALARFTVLLIKTDGQWLIAHQHSSPERAKEDSAAESRPAC